VPTTVPRVLTLTCPATYVGNILDGNGTYVDLSVSGNATVFSVNPCGGVVLTYTNENPPSFVQTTRDTDPLLSPPNSTVQTITTGNQIMGHYEGVIDSYTDLSMGISKRSVTWPTSFGQSVGNFATTYNVPFTPATDFTWNLALETDGVIRYALYNTNQSFAILQTDYYDIGSNAHFFNPGEVFPAQSFCNPVDNQTGWIHDLKRDVVANRYVFVYMNPANYSKICLVVSNTNDFFNGGGIGYSFDLPFAGFSSVSNFRLAIYKNVYAISFNDFNQSLANNAIFGYVGPLYWGNVFLINRISVLNANTTIGLCNAQPNQIFVFSLSPLYQSIGVIHQSKTYRLLDLQPYEFIFFF
jgi:hypothetical protein